MIFYIGGEIGWLLPKLSDCRGLPASGVVAADTRKMSFRYSQLCGTASDAVDAVRSAIPKGFKFEKYKLR